MEEDKRKSSRILVVDNDEGLLSTIQEYLTLCDYQVKTVSSGLDALQHIRSETYDVLLTDIVMPGISGIETARRIKGMDRKHPVILMSGYIEKEGLPEEIDLFLEKPVEAERLLREIELAGCGR